MSFEGWNLEDFQKLIDSCRRDMNLALGNWEKARRAKEEAELGMLRYMNSKC
jgi:hypothetical protein